MALVCTGAFLVGMLSMKIACLPQTELSFWLDHRVTVTGVITERKEGNYFFLLKPQQINGQALLCSTTLAVLPKYGDEGLYAKGQTITLYGQLKKPLPRTNPGGFDAAAWWRTQGVFYQLEAEEEAVHVADSRGIYRAARQLQTQVRQQLTAYLPAHQKHMVLALLFGEKANLDEDFYALSQKMGIAHVFAVSGLHVGFLLTFLMGIFRLLHLERTWLAVWMTALLIGFYCLLVDFTPSAVRASIMAILTLLAHRFMRFRDSFTVLAAAALAVLWLQPFALWSVGFQLSFGVTWALLYAYPMCTQWLIWIPWPWLRQSCAVALAAQLGSLPLTAWYSYYVSAYGLLLNLMLVPLIGIAVPLLLLSLCITALVPWIGPFLYGLSSLSLSVVEAVLTVTAYWLGTGQYYIGQPPLLAIGLYLFFWIACREKWWLRIRFRPLRRALLLGSFIMILMLWLPERTETPRLTYLDVGQGSGAVAVLPTGRALVFDGGNQKGTVAAYLAYCGINRVEAVVISHGDSDHITGLDQVLRDFSVQYVLAEASQLKREEIQPLLLRARQKGIDVVAIKNGAHLVCSDQTELFVQVYDDGETGSNSRELAAIWKAGPYAAAFPGDLGQSGLEELAADWPNLQLWAVPHHGSKFSCSEKLYQNLRPALAVLSAGRENSYGHPHKIVLETLAANHIPYVRTDKQGAILVDLGLELTWQVFCNFS